MNSKLEHLLNKVAVKFPTSGIAPGLVVSFLDKKKEYYVSVVKYSPKKEVIISSYNKLLSKAIEDIQCKLEKYIKVPF